MVGAMEQRRDTGGRRRPREAPCTDVPERTRALTSIADGTSTSLVEPWVPGLPKLATTTRTSRRRVDCLSRNSTMQEVDDDGGTASNGRSLGHVPRT
jgi:hypothetical protein